MPHDLTEGTTHCAGLPHEQLTVSLSWCSHDDSVTAWVTIGPVEDPDLSGPITFGPFDGSVDIASWAFALVARWHNSRDAVI
jgi:hypothetical protein